MRREGLAWRSSVSGSGVSATCSGDVRVEDELRREMEAHRALMEEPRAFGNTLRLRDEARDAWGWTWLDDFVQDTRFALRTLRRSPGFALTAIVTLALGIGVNIGMFSLVNGLLLRPLYERPDEVVGVYSRSTAPDGESRGVSYPNYLDLREGTTDIFANLAASSTIFVGLDVGEGPRRTLASAVTANYFQIFGLPLALGRPFTAEEERLGADIRVAIISHSLWEQRGADPNMLGRPVRVNGEPFTVVGVAPEGFTGASIPGPEVWLPLGAHGVFSTEGASAGPAFGAREAHELTVVGRLRAGTSVETRRAGARHRGPPTRAGVSGDQRRLHARDVGAFASHVHARPRKWRDHCESRPAADGHAGDRPARGVPEPRRSAAGPRSGAPAGDGHQVVARGRPRAPHSATGHRRAAPRVGRRRCRPAPVDVGDRRAAGFACVPCSPSRLSLPELDLDWRVLVGTVGFSLAATLVFGAWPAWALTVARSRPTSSDTFATTEARRSGGIRIGNALVIGQVALSLLLLASGGLFLMSALSAATADPGFRLDGGLLVEVDPSSGGLRRSARETIASRAGGSAANGPGRGSRDHRIEFSFYVNRGQSRRGSGWRRRCASRDRLTQCSLSSAATTREPSGFPCLAAGISATPNWHPAPRSGSRSSTTRSRSVSGRERTHSGG